MSNIIIEGNIGSPEIRDTANGRPMIKFGLYETRKKGDEKVYTWYDVIAFDELANNTYVSVLKGSRLIVSGRLEGDEYVNNNGQKVKKFTVVADAIGVSLRFDPLGVGNGEQLNLDEEPF